MDLILKKGGKLSLLKWDEKTQGYKEKNETSRLQRHLFKPIKIEAGVTLKDLFLLIRRHLPLLNEIYGFWLPEFTAEALSRKKSTKDNDITYLELYWLLQKEVDNGKTILNGNLFPSFHGIRENEDGSSDGISVGHSNLRDLIEYPLVLNPHYLITEDSVPFSSVDHGEAEFSLHHLIYGVLWEISFHGSPRQRDIFREQIRKDSGF